MSAAFWGTMAVFGVIAILAFGFLLLVTRYKRCASDEILVVYGRVGGGKASKCIHGGATMVWPLIKDFKKKTSRSAVNQFQIDFKAKLCHKDSLFSKEKNLVYL